MKRFVSVVRRPAYLRVVSTGTVVPENRAAQQGRRRSAGRVATASTAVVAVVAAMVLSLAGSGLAGSALADPPTSGGSGDSGTKQ